MRQAGQFSEPNCGNLLDLLNAFENEQVQPFVPDHSVVTLDICVLLRFAGLNVGQGYAAFLGPFHEGATDVFGAVVGSNCPWGTTPFDDLVQGSWVFVTRAPVSAPFVAERPASPLCRGGTVSCGS